MRRWLRRRGLLDERAAEDRSNEAPELSPLEACMQMSLFGSTYVRLAGDGAPVPRFPLQRFSGVLAPRSALRAAVVPSGPVARAFATPRKARAKTKGKTKRDEASPWVSTAEGTSPERESVAPSGRRTSLGDGVVTSGGGRLEWAQLLRRIYLVDVLAYTCGGRRAIVGDISDSEVVVAIVAHLGLPPLAPPMARARSPAFELA